MHASGVGKSRAERVQQVRRGDPHVLDFGSYVAVGDAAMKLNTWSRQGAEIAYLSSHRDESDVARDRTVLLRAGFPDGHVWHRRPGQEYRDVVEDLQPDVLIEDDCESIGGIQEMTYTSLDSATKARLHSIVVPEFGGIDHLPETLGQLRSM
ncbi:MAG TPA: hypothetical protein VF148_04275 [Acidimicrobiia bacterium]